MKQIRMNEWQCNMNLLKHKKGKNPYGLKMDGYPYTQGQTIALFHHFEITEEELADLNEWVKEGNTFYHNPWLIFTNKGNMANFIEGHRFVKDMNEQYFDQCLLPTYSPTDPAFIYLGFPT